MTPGEFQLAQNKMWQLIHEGELDSREIGERIDAPRDAVRAIILRQKSYLCSVCCAQGMLAGKTCARCAGLGAI